MSKNQILYQTSVQPQPQYLWSDWLLGIPSHIGGFLLHMYCAELFNLRISIMQKPADLIIIHYPRWWQIQSLQLLIKVNNNIKNTGNSVPYNMKWQFKDKYQKIVFRFPPLLCTYDNVCQLSITNYLLLLPKPIKIYQHQHYWKNCWTSSSIIRGNLGIISLISGQTGPQSPHFEFPWQQIVNFPIPISFQPFPSQALSIEP